MSAISAMLMATAFLSLVSCRSGSGSAEGTTAGSDTATIKDHDEAEFSISLAQWSLHNTFLGEAVTDWQGYGRRMLNEDPDGLIKGTDPLEFPRLAADFGIHTIELLNIFYYGKTGDMSYWESFKKRCKDAGVRVGLIMCDMLGNLGDPDPVARAAAVENHHDWVDIASFLGASSIRVNAAGEGTPEEVADRVVEGLSKLARYGARKNVNIIVENSGGISSDASWLAGVLDRVGLENVGTLPDFGNFCLEGRPPDCISAYDRYQGMAELMPYAMGVSAKSYDFDQEGNETHMDYFRLMKIVKESGFRGDIGIEYNGTVLSESDGIRATKALLEKVIHSLQTPD